MLCCYTKGRKRRDKKGDNAPKLHKVRKSIIEPYEACQTSTEFTELFMSEIITCGPCGKAFTLRQDEVVAYCGGCFKFLHCNIAGKCVGPNCSYKIKDEDYRQTWCKSCVPQTIIINIEDNGPRKDCLCQECLDDPATHKKYKQKI